MTMFAFVGDIWS